ncbi:lysM and putative peptidoglycan-binding domain-containing protein 4 [Notolabrus celidotus]|uniref:lysM and putative peptidoglycan-binding domain-containing protein 4 n=1 Tax=Notolabrus celidotus TaxID=1203425 RepID=UPI00148F5414|nr:lysM and putative peptidoglycan-binding domain-containing protein 4 [Notolabrus celidotus]XP_034542075.1 lysM and putative peptidoglycan-binding domain-containing protein 4 [Notolabrus celidotus]XP_034542076.1 lysM and putative peptidoglycan-binding domain-containing protein 4 [Notolabrus celidotus]XP_034542077.1 lysM and putative peptidoglycan-binding domain-containing protein 4 [Notolabrus celidotus]
MRRGEHAARAFQAPVDVHASADGQVYMFRRLPNESAASSDEEELTVMEMRPRLFREYEQDRLRNVQLLEREVLDGDNLNKLALQYGCKVADIKRVNNLMQEQDLFALKSIKIPVQKHSFLTEAAYTDLSEPQEETPHSSTSLVKPEDTARGQTHLKEVTDFLMEVDQDIEKLIQTTDDQDEDFLDNLERQQKSGLKGRSLTGHGADWGIQWWNAVVAMLLIGIVLPLFYVIYFKTKDNGVVSPTNGSVVTQASNISSNTSGMGLVTRGAR